MLPFVFWLPVFVLPLDLDIVDTRGLNYAGSSASLDKSALGWYLKEQVYVALFWV